MGIAIATVWAVLLGRGRARDAAHHVQPARPAAVATQADVLHILKRAHALLSQPHRLSQGAMARDAQGQPVPVRSPQAYAFSAVGAAVKCSLLGSEHAVRLLDTAARELFGASLRALNKSRDHARILAVYEHAIASVALQ
jgi:hypothetical protein